MRQISIPEQLADEIRDWAHDQLAAWPDDTAFHHHLKFLLQQLDEGLPTADDVRGIMAQGPKGKKPGKSALGRA